MNRAQAQEIKKRSYRRNDCWFCDVRTDGKWVVTATDKKRRSIVGEGVDNDFTLATAKAILDLEEKQHA